jgi:FkbM family methyltransferase
MKKINDWYVPDRDQYSGEKPLEARLEMYKAQSDWLKKHIKHTNLYIDIGANFGHTIIPFKRLFKKIVGFEITPDNFQCLIENTRKSPNVVCYNLGLSNQHTMVNVLEYKTAGSVNTIQSTRLITDSSRNRSPMVVQRPVTTLDLMFPTEIASFIKIDVEGHEVEVLKGGRELISRSQGLLYIETSDKNRESICSLLGHFGWKYISRRGKKDLKTGAEVVKKTTDLLFKKR